MKTSITTSILALACLASCAGGNSRSNGLPASTTVTRNDSGLIRVSGRDTASVLQGMEMAARGQVTPTHVSSPAPSPSKNSADLEAEKELRRKVKNNQFMPGDYQGGPIKYSTGNGVQTFTP
jgi:hypothetical protein